MELGQLPLFDQLKDSQTVLPAGAGGGFDLFHGLPIYFWLTEQKKTVVLANLTFSNLYGIVGRQLADAVIEVGADSGGSKHYFPEKHLCQWFWNRGESLTIHCIHRTGYVPIRDAYNALEEHYKPDTVILVDGGTDSLMRGDECGLGTPQEDMASIAAVNELKAPKKLLACIGYGVDAYHGVCHAQFLESVAALVQVGGFLGTFSLMREMREAELYRNALTHVFNAMPEHPSIVGTSILSALDGDFGDVHRSQRTYGSKLWINPLMSMYWAFDLPAVAKRCLYMDRIKETRTYEELTEAIRQFRFQMDAIKPWENMPV